MIVSIPCSLSNSLDCYWILMSLRRTISYLKLHNQGIKLAIIRQFAYSVLILIIVAFFIFMFDVIVKLGLERDTHWKLEWVFQSIWFMLYTAFLLWIIYLIRPNERSKMLADLHELNETSTSHRGPGECIELSEATPGRGSEIVQKVVHKNGKRVI